MTDINTIATGEILIRDVPFHADPSGALWQDDARLLIVADLHLEKGSSLAKRRGALLPPFDTRTTLGRLAKIISHFKPERVIALGDTWHDNNGPTRLDAEDGIILQKLTDQSEFFFIAGNHDAKPAAHNSRNFVDTLHVSGITFRHEPQAGADYEIAGHLHPAAKVKARGRAVRRRCFIANTKRIILPAFGAYAGGLNVCDDAFLPLFPERDFLVHLLGDERTYAASAAQILPD